MEGKHFNYKIIGLTATVLLMTIILTANTKMKSDSVISVFYPIEQSEATEIILSADTEANEVIVESKPNPAQNNPTSEIPSVTTSEPTQKSLDNLQMKIHSYMSNEDNRNSVMKAALDLHEGDPHNACVYFASEALRRVGVEIPISTCSTGDFYNKLLKNGWSKTTELNTIKLGDICFTTNGDNGEPTHTFIFMGWANSGSLEYANICDNQSYDYETVLHLRNISIALVRNGIPKEATAYFMQYK